MVEHQGVYFVVFFGVSYFPAYSWVLAKLLLSGWLVGWLVGGKSCLSRVACLSACGRGPPGPSVPCLARQERRDSAECIVQRRFGIRVDSVPSCKLGPARTRPRVWQQSELHTGSYVCSFVHY